MAQAFPASQFRGFDTHRGIRGRGAAGSPTEAGVAEQATFATARADDYPGKGYDLICFFDSLHDMGDPVAAVAHAAKAIARDGTVLLVEPFANDRVEDNISPVAQDLLRRLHHDLLRACDLRGRPHGARRAGRRGAARGRVPQGRLHPFPPRRRDAVQPDPRGSALIALRRQ